MPQLVLKTLWFVGLTFAFAALSGCGTLDRGVGQLGARHHSYDLVGERVDIQMLTGTQLEELASVDHFNFKLDYLADRRANLRFLAPEAIAAVVKLGADIIIDQIKKEEARYQQQFSASTFAPDFWLEDQPGSQYAGFMIQRFTKAGGDKKPAFVFIAGIVPIYKGGFVEVLPLYLEDSRPKAKVVGDVVHIKITFTQKSQWIDADGSLHDETLKTFAWEPSAGYILPDGPMRFNYYGSSGAARLIAHHVSAGALVGPPRTFGASADKPAPIAGSGLMELTLMVDEADATEAQKYIKRVREEAEKNKDKAVEAILKKLHVTPKPADSQ